MRFFWFKFANDSIEPVCEHDDGAICRFGSDEHWENREHFTSEYLGEFKEEIIRKT